MKKLIVSIVAGIVIAGGAFFTGRVDDVGTAVQIAFDKESAEEYCGKLLNADIIEVETQPAE